MIFFIYTIIFPQSDSVAVTILYDSPSLKVRMLELELISKAISIYNSKAKQPLKPNFKLVNSRLEVYNSIASQVGKKQLICGLVSATILKGKKRIEYSSGYLPVQDVLISNLNQKNINPSERFKVAYKNSKHYSALFSSASRRFNIEGLIFNHYEDAAKTIASGESHYYIGDSIDTWEHENRKIVLKLNNNVLYLGFIYPKNSKLKGMLDPILKYIIKSPYFFRTIKQIFGDRVLKEYKKTLLTLRN